MQDAPWHTVDAPRVLIGFAIVGLCCALAGSLLTWLVLG